MFSTDIPDSISSVNISSDNISVDVSSVNISSDDISESLTAICGVVIFGSGMNSSGSHIGTVTVSEGFFAFLLSNTQFRMDLIAILIID